MWFGAEDRKQKYDNTMKPANHHNKYDQIRRRTGLIWDMFWKFLLPFLLKTEENGDNGTHRCVSPFCLMNFDELKVLFTE